MAQTAAAVIAELRTVLVGQGLQHWLWMQQNCWRMSTISMEMYENGIIGSGLYGLMVDNRTLA